MGMDPDSSSGISTQTCQVGGQDCCPFTCWGREWECETRGVPSHPVKRLLFKESLLSEDWGLCSSLSLALSLSYGTMEIAQRGEGAGHSINTYDESGEGLTWWSSGEDFTFQCRGFSLIPGWGVKILHALPSKNQNIKQKQCCNKFNKDFKNGPCQKKKKRNRGGDSVCISLTWLTVCLDVFGGLWFWMFVFPTLSTSEFSNLQVLS